MRIADPLRAAELERQNELLQQFGYRWHLEQWGRGRTHKRRWVLLHNDGSEIRVLDALEAIEQERGEQVCI